MQIHLSPRHLKLTGAIHAYVADKITHLETISDDIIAAHVVLIYDEHADPEKRHHVKVHLAVPGKDIHAEDTEGDLYASIDKVAAKLGRQLRKRKTRIIDKSKQKAQQRKERVKGTPRS